MSKEHEREKKIEALRKLRKYEKDGSCDNHEQDASGQLKKEETQEQKADAKTKEGIRVEELTETLQRLQAEFENYKKRAEKEKQEIVKYAEERLIISILPILDSFELALKNTGNKETFTKGVEMIFAQLYSALESRGLRPIEATGKIFDPYKHEALMKAFSEKEEEIVIEELQRGYMLNNRVIRHSKVKISQGRKDDNKANSAEKSA